MLKDEAGVASIVLSKTYKEGYICDTKYRWQDNIKISYI
jgi:hypothetical protein